MEENQRKTFSNPWRTCRVPVLNALLIAVTLLACVLMLEYSTVTVEMGLVYHLQTISMSSLLLNYLTVGVFLSVLWILCNRAWLACLLCSIISGGVAIANYYVLQFHGMPLSFQTLRNFATAMNVISNYSLMLDKCVVLLIAIILFSCALCLLVGHFTKCSKIPIRKVLIRDVTLAAIGCAVMYFGYFSSNPVKPANVIAWSWLESYGNYGYAACSVESFWSQFNIINQPDGYSEETVEAIEIPRNGAEDVSTPDIILILNETFYDLEQITKLETDVDYLPNIRTMDNLLTGYAVTPGAGGSTNSAEYELLTSNSLQLMPGITPFNTINLNNANSIVSHLNALGYSTTGSHSEPAENYSRGVGYQALGFQNAYFEEDFQDTRYYYDRRFETDESLYSNLIRWYEEAPEDTPRFQYMLTIQNHGAWDGNDPRYDTVHALNDFGEYDGFVDEFLTCISQTDQAFKDLTDYFAQVDRPVILCMMGDHAPNFASSIASESLSAEEKALNIRKVPLLIWANFDLEQTDLGTMSMSYVVPTLLKLAGVELSPYYSYMLQLKQNVPILSSYGSYYDTDGNLYYYDEDAGAEYEAAVDTYFYLEYNNLSTGRKQELFDPYA